MKSEIVWVRSKKTGRLVPCEPKTVRFIINPYSSDVYYTLDGERFRGIEHPSGALIGHKVKPNK